MLIHIGVRNEPKGSIYYEYDLEVDDKYKALSKYEYCNCFRQDAKKMYNTLLNVINDDLGYKYSRNIISNTFIYLKDASYGSLTLSDIKKWIGILL